MEALAIERHVVSASAALTVTVDIATEQPQKKGTT